MFAVQIKLGTSASNGKWDGTTDGGDGGGCGGGGGGEAVNCDMFVYQQSDLVRRRIVSLAIKADDPRRN